MADIFLSFKLYSSELRSYFNLLIRISVAKWL